ncbi:UNVERIFIED_CONTAM: GntR family transcriptional regulator [Williamsia faeni]
MESGQGVGWASVGAVAADSVRTPKASEQIADRLRGQIVRGEIATGEMLPPEKTLIQYLGVSRPTLREAFRILESEGLITVVTGSRGGAKAQLPDLGIATRQIGQYLQVHNTTLADLLEARTDFETACVRHLADRCPPEGLQAFKRCLAAHRAALDKGVDDPAAFSDWVALTAEFHELIARYCGNKTLEVQVSVLSDVLLQHRQMGIKQREEDVEVPSRTSYIPWVIDDYATLIVLVEARDSAGAERHWRRHLEAATEVTYRNRDRQATVSVFN